MRPDEYARAILTVALDDGELSAEQALHLCAEASRDSRIAFETLFELTVLASWGYHQLAAQRGVTVQALWKSVAQERALDEDAARREDDDA